jgi:hypothetical protein
MGVTVPTLTDSQANPRQGGDNIRFLQIPRAYYDYITFRNKKSRVSFMTNFLLFRGAGTDVARASAGIVLAKNDPRDVARIVKLSDTSYRKMRQNLAWAVGYTVIALPLAAGVLAPHGFVLPAYVGAVLMALSTIIVAIKPSA